MEAVCGGDRHSCDMAPAPDHWHAEAWDFWNFNTAQRFGNFGQGEWFVGEFEDLAALLLAAACVAASAGD